MDEIIEQTHDQISLVQDLQQLLSTINQTFRTGFPAELTAYALNSRVCLGQVGPRNGVSQAGVPSSRYVVHVSMDTNLQL
jgi:hypothetical protein